MQKLDKNFKSSGKKLVGLKAKTFRLVMKKGGDNDFFQLGVVVLN
jgi:hypothetical protein